MALVEKHHTCDLHRSCGNTGVLSITITAWNDNKNDNEEPLCVEKLDVCSMGKENIVAAIKAAVKPRRRRTTKPTAVVPTP